MRLLMVVVGQALRRKVEEVLKRVGFILEQGYSEGSTAWTFILETDLPAAQVQRRVWEKLPQAQVTVETLEEEQHQSE